MPKYITDEAKNAELYLLGYPEDEAAPTRRRRRGLDPYHRQKMRMMEEMAEEYWDCKITKVSFGNNDRPNRAHTYFRTAFASKSPGDAVIIYFTGTGTGKHRGYSW